MQLCFPASAVVRDGVRRTTTSYRRSAAQVSVQTLPYTAINDGEGSVLIHNVN